MTKSSAKDVNASKKAKTSRVKGRTTNKRNKKDGGCCTCITQYAMLIIMVFGLTFTFLKQNIYNKHYTSVSGSGELSIRHVVNDINTMICQDYKLTTWKPSNVYLTSGEARVDTRRRSVVHRSGGQLYPNSMTTDNSFYLLEGSYMKFNACRIQNTDRHHDQDVDLLIFKGDNSWNEFKSGSCSDCTEMNTSLPLNDICDRGPMIISTYTASERDTYYFAVVKRSEGYNTFYLDVRSDLMISKTTFDTEDAKMICTQESECLVPLKYNEDVDVVVTFPDDTFITTECIFRTMFCVGIFVVFPACLLIVGFTCCGVVIICEKKEKRNKTRNKLNINTIEGEEVDEKDKSVLVKNEVPPSYDSLNHV